MKTVLRLIPCLIVVSFSVSAQFEKGTFSYGGSLGGNTSKTTYPAFGGNSGDKMSFQSITIGPNIGYFLFNNFLIGGGINYQYEKSKQNQPAYELKTDLSALSLSPYVRYYIKHFYAMAGFSEGYGRVYASESQPFTGVGFNDESKSNTFYQKYYLAVGYAIMVTHQIAIEPEVGYSYAHDFPSIIMQKENQSGFYFQVELRVYLHKDKG